MLAVVNEARITLPGPRLLHDLISTSTGDRIAIDFLLDGDSRVSLTYDAFRDASSRLAYQIRLLLAKYGAKRHIVPVIIPQCPELYLAWRALLHAGACVCPVQHDVPPERLKFIVSDVSANTILCLGKDAPRLRSILPTVDCITICLNDLQHDDHADHPDMGSHSQSCEIKATDPAYVMYTSGSTGIPKGVMVSHISITQSLLAHERHVPRFKRFLQFASPTFDVSIFEIFFPFFRGETLVSCSREQMLADLPGTIVALGADAAELTPTVAGTLLRTRAAAPCLRTLLTIGEMLTKNVVEEFGGSETQESMLFAMYGPTEAAVHCTIAPRLPASSSVRNIGRPLVTTTAFILKETSHSDSPEIAQKGDSGELALAGQLADGYLNRSDQTEAAFVTLPDYGQIYRTGDRAMCLSDGSFEILGRTSDGQVKLRGQRVELGEIEEIASKSDGVSMAVAIIVEDMLVLFCESDCSVQQVQATCKAWLPPFMRPGEVIILTAGFPRLPSGKIDRKTLESNYRNEIAQSSLPSPDAMSDTERALAKNFELELGRSISTHTDLWSCGLDSLRAIRIASRLRQDFPSITINDILECESVKELAGHLQTKRLTAIAGTELEQEQSDEWPTAQILARNLLSHYSDSISRIVPCSAMQIAMLAENSSKPQLNFNYVRLKTAPDVSYSQMWDAICELAEANEILRSGFLFTGSSSNPFVRIVWKHLEEHDFDMLHPLHLTTEQHEGEEQFVLRIHHALYDGWSWELILDDLNIILAGRTAPTRPSFDAVRIWQRERGQTSAKRANQYWNRLLTNHVQTFLPALTSSRNTGPSQEAVTRDLTVSYSKLSSLSAELRTSRQAFLQVCWALLLSAYTDSSDVLFATITSGRHVPVEGVDQTIGPCLSALPSRVQLASLRTVKDLLLYLQRQWLGNLEHSSSSLHDILKSIDRSSGQRLFDSVVVWQEGEKRSPSQRKFVATGEVEDVLDYTAVLEIEPVVDCLRAKLTVATATIPVAHATLLLQQIDDLMSLMVSNVDIELANVWRSSSESSLSVSNSRCTTFQNHQDITDTIQRLSREDCMRPALKFVKDYDPSTGKLDLQVLSYGDLHHFASNVAGNLAADYGIHPDDLIAIIAEKSRGLYIVILGTIMCGAGYLCIDPNTPPKRLRAILREAKCALILADKSLDLAEVETVLPTVKLDSVLHVPTEERKKSSYPALHHLAYAVFTSGTTKLPKGVLVTRQNLISNILCLSRMYPCEPLTDSLLQACSPAFDVSVFEIFWTWHMGMTLCAATNDVLFRGLEGLIDRLGVTHLSLTPSVAALLDPRETPQVKMLVTAGEPMNSKVFQFWTDHGLYQGYGPSETTNICNVRPAVTAADLPDNVGSPLPNTSVFVCAKTTVGGGDAETQNLSLSSKDFNMLPKGAIGEVWIGGEQVCRGYTDEDLTAQSFFEHPSYGRLYRSGDVGRLLSDDSLVIAGRIDDQTKIRGQRIELGEINNVLLESGVVQDAFSLVQGKNDTSRLLSFCAMPGNKLPETPEGLMRQLFSRLEASLPSYMIPDIIVPVSKMPLTKQGKVNKQELLLIYEALSPDDVRVFSRGQQPGSEESQLDNKDLALAEALVETLGLGPDAVRANLSFYALGLDSISAIRFSQVLSQHGFGQVDVSTILKHPSVQALAPLLKRNAERKTARPEDSLMSLQRLFDPNWLAKISTQLHKNKMRVQKVLPCTDLQQSMLSSSEDGAPGAYNNTLRFAVNGDPDRLKQAWSEVISRHDLLRCIFLRCPNSTTPYVQAVLETELHWQDCELSLPRLETDEVLPIIPYRLTIHKMDARAIEFRIDMHHALYDAEAMTSLLQEVELSYHDRPLLPTCSFEKYLNYTMNLDQGEMHSFWEEQLRDVEPCRLADCIPAPSTADRGRLHHVYTTCNVTLIDLESSGRSQEVSMLSVLQCALARLLFRFFGSQDVCFGNVFSGRNLQIDGILRAFGPCFNTLPVRAQAKRHTSNQQLVSTLQNTNVRVLPLQPSSPRQIQRLHGLDDKPLFDVLLLFQQPSQLLDSKIWKLLGDTGDMNFPFILEICQDRDCNELRAILHSGVVTEDVLKPILACFDDLLNHCVRYPQAPVLDFTWMNLTLPLQPPHLEQSQRSRQADSLEPDEQGIEFWSEVETRIRELMLSLSPAVAPKISKQTSLFKMGLDSISAVQMAAQLRKHGYSISSIDLLEASTVSEIAARCLVQSPKPQSETDDFDLATFDARCRPYLRQSEKLNLSTVESIRPCTPTQLGILMQYLKSEGRTYFNTMCLRLMDGVDLAKLRKSWEVAMHRHEMLRTGFAECTMDTHSFVMVTYRPEAMSLPWEGGNGQKSPFKRLIKPPWRLCLSPQMNSLYLDLSMLHALYDAKSQDTLLAEVANCYLGNDFLDVPDITRTVSAILARTESEEAKSFWQEQHNTIQPTQFPDLNIYRTQERTLATLTRKAAMSLSDLQSRAASLDCNLQTIFQAAWARLLAGYTGQSHVTFGLILSGRIFGDRRDKAVFPCINTVPCSIDTASTNLDTLAHISTLNTQLSRFQHTPLTSIKRWQQLEAEPFDTILVLQKFESLQPEQAPWEIVEEKATAEYTVSLEVLLHEQRNELVYRASYSESVLPVEAATNMLNQLDNFVGDIFMVEPGLRTEDDLSVISPRHDRLPSASQFLHSLVEETADRTPNITALEFVRGFDSTKVIIDTWTYAELESEGNRIAHLLLQNGAETGDIIAICFDKCPQASFAILGALKAGCGYAAIDPGAPVDRKQFILQDCGSKIVLTMSDRVAEFPVKDGLKVFDLNDAETSRQLSAERPTLATPLNRHDTCYCLYTSGTTGAPKGCLVSHDSAVQAMLSFESIFRGHWTSDSRWLQFASFHFDVSVLEQYWSWYVGICVTSAPRDLMLEDLPGFIQKMKITHLDLTPSLARLLTPELVPSLCEGVFIVGGEQVSADIIDTWGDARCLYNFYGPSEVTIGCTVRPRVTQNTKPANIGRQWDNVGTYVLEPGTERAVVRGGVGELCLSGVLVGKGYLNRPELTEKSFVHLKKYGERVYRTGDLVRLLHDDSFEFLGRIDDQVKLRGQRLEIGEINQVVRRASSDVKSVTTIVITQPAHGKEQLVAFFSTSETRRHENTCDVMSTPQARNFVAKLRRHCLDKLPGYMVPSSFLMISSMPLTINNKIDTKRLAELYKSTFDVTNSQAAHSTIEYNTEIFGKVVTTLGGWFHVPREHIQRGSSLFELGLDSVSAIGLSKKLKTEGFAHSTTATVMRNSIVADLVETLSTSETTKVNVEDTIKTSKHTISAFERKHHSAAARALRVQANEIESVAPCTPLQEGMISKVASAGVRDLPYFAQFHYDLKDNVDPDKVKHAWVSVQESTSILRTYFVETADGFAQVVLKKPVQPAGVVRRNTSWTKNAFTDWVALARSFGTVIPWRLAISPTWGKTYMTLFIFHGLYDGISLQLLLDKVAGAYKSPGMQSPDSEFYKILSYGPLRQEPDAKGFWCSRLPFTRKLDLEAKHESRTPDQPLRRPSRSRFVSADLDQLCKRLKITLSGFFQAAWLVCLQQVYGVNPSLGLVVSGRSLQNDDAETVIGPMFNTIPFAVDGLPENAEFQDLAKTCHQFNVDILPFQHTPLRDIAKWRGRDPRDSLFDNLFVFQKEAQGEARDLWKAMPNEVVPDYPLNLEVDQKLDGSFVTTLVAKQEYLDRSEVDALLLRLVEVLERGTRGEEIALPNDFKSKTKAEEAGRDETIPRLNSTNAENDVHAAGLIATTVRSHIVELSGIDASKIGLARPSLFELGLDSVDAMKLATRLRNAGYSIPVSKIMQIPTVGEMARYLKNRDRATSDPDRRLHRPVAATIDARQNHYRTLLSATGDNLQNVERILPVTAMQEGLLLDFEEYYHTMTFELEMDVDVDRLKRAWLHLSREQPILRTSFVAIENPQSGDAFLQVVRRSDPWTLSAFWGKARNQSLRGALEGVNALARSEGMSVPTVQVRFLEEDEKRFMVFGMPHAAYDAWSLHLLHQRVAKAYFEGIAASKGGADPYEAHLEAVFHDASSEESKSFWRKTLQNVHPAMFPPANEGASGQRSQFLKRRIKTPLSSALELCKSIGVTLQSLGLACWSLTLAHYTRSRDVCFGLVLSGRTTESADSLIFPTFNTVLFRSQIGESETLESFLRDIHDHAVRVSEHQHFPLREAVKLADSDRTQSGLFNTLFTYQKVPERDSSVRQLYHEIGLPAETRNPPYAVNAEMEGRDDELWWTFATQEGVLSKAGLDEAFAMIEHVLQRLIERRHSPLLERIGGRTSICGLTPMTLETKLKPLKQLGDEADDDSEDWTQTESKIRQVLAEVAKTDLSTIKKTTGLFNLGLDSISAIKVTGLLKKCGLRITVSKIVEAQTVKRMAQFAEAIQASETVGGKNQIQATEAVSSQYSNILKQHGLALEDVETVSPATAGQTYMLDLWARSNGRLCYPCFWLVVEGVTKDEFDQALETLAVQVPMLRTTFIQASSAAEMRTLQVALSSEASRRYPLPWSYSVDEDDGKLLVALKVHHALYDAVSLHIMIEELQKLCSRDQLQSHERVNIDARPFLSLTNAVEGGVKAQQKQFWTEYLQSSSASMGQGSFGAPRTERFILRLVPISKLDGLLMRRGISIQSLFFAICGRICARLTPEAEPNDGNQAVIGVYLANRSLDIPELPTLAAPTFNVVPLKINVSRDLGLVQAAREVQDDIAQVSKVEHCGVSLRAVYEWTGRKLDFVVNFLKVPGSKEVFEHEDGAGRRDERRGRVRHADGKIREKMKEVSQEGEAASPFLDQSAPLKDKLEWCVPSIDVEAKIENGWLGVGVFAPEDMLDGSWAEEMIDEIKKASEEVERAN